MTPADIERLIRTIPDFPAPGILFRDVTTLIGDPEGFAATVAMLADQVAGTGACAIAGIEARGFIFGAAVAARMGLGFVPVRKPGKLPVPSLSVDYALEYGMDTLEIDPGAITAGAPVALIDDLLATGGTASAAAGLLRTAGAIVTDALFVVDLPDLGGGDRLRASGITVSSLVSFPGD